jgi:two-component system chemotaxis response regulator CheB
MMRHPAGGCQCRAPCTARCAGSRAHGNCRSGHGCPEGGVRSPKARATVPGRDIIVIGASAGGVEALSSLVRGLPAGLPAALFVVVHFPPDSTSVLPAILSRAGPLRAAHAVHGERMEHGRIYVAPPDRHLLVQHGHVHLSRGPRENATRPAVDPLFRTAAQAYGPRVVGVVLSGTLDDGTVGLGMVRKRGGVAVAQDPADAAYPGMPTSAIENVGVDHVLPAGEMGALLAHLAAEGPEGGDVPPPPLTEYEEYEIDVADMDPEAVLGRPPLGPPSGLTCPECRGSVWEMGEGESLHFRCRIGHSYSPETFFSQQAGVVEAAIWSAMQVLEERVQLARRMEERMARRGHPRIAARYREQAGEASEQAEVLRRVLAGADAAPVEAVSAGTDDIG